MSKKHSHKSKILHEILDGKNRTGIGFPVENGDYVSVHYLPDNTVEVTLSREGGALPMKFGKVKK